MRLVSFRSSAGSGFGVHLGDRVVEVGVALNDRSRWPAVATLDDLIAAGPGALDAIREIIADEDRHELPTHATADVRLLAPLVRPPKMWYAGRNYREHAAEAALDVLPYPACFIKLSTGIVGPDEPIRLPAQSKKVDFEAELAVVIGTAAHGITSATALEHVAGYLVANDVSARDIQLEDKQLALGKNFRTFAPLGPWIVTADEVPDPQDLRLRLWLNGNLMQDGSTADMIYPVAEIIAYLSTVTGLEAGDVVSTGTPSGIGYARQPQVLLADGDIVRVEIDGIGSMENSVQGSR